MIATSSRSAAAVSPAGRLDLPALLARPYPAVMGVLNITPDSFSDGGAFITPKRALAQARLMVMHNRDSADPAIDIMADISAFFARSLDIADKAGIARENIVLDPGIGFGKTPEQSMTALARLGELRSFGLAILVGASRKRF